MDTLKIRPIHPEDIPSVCEVERMSFPSPWDRETFIATIEDRRCISVLGTCQGEVAGYCLAMNLTSMVHILNLAVHPSWRGRGVARRLVDEILRKASESGRLCAVLEVRKSNTAARSLYESLGFVQVSTWRGYYSDTNEDASIMVKNLRKKQVGDTLCTVVRNTEVASSTWHIVLEGDMPRVDSGQFVMVQAGDSIEPFLRRPLAVLSQKGGVMELLYRVRGKGTELLAGKKTGDTVRVLGPLGRGFTKRSADHVFYVAGGTGLPPLIHLAERINKGTFIVGAQTKDGLYMLDRLLALQRIELVVMTEDGSSGGTGLATDALARLLEDVHKREDAVIYACGPRGMLRQVAILAAESGAYCEVSLEERMACGFGVCSGCVVRTTDGNERVCREGPVFDASRIVWD